jgi:hypothetical protein
LDERAGVKVIGLDDTIKGLKLLGASAKEMSDVGYVISREVATRARSLAPSRTGALRTSIVAARTNKGARLQTRKPLVYAAPIHWGWPSRNIRPNVFMLKAIGSRPAIYNRYQVELNKLIAKYNTGKVTK